MQRSRKKWIDYSSDSGTFPRRRSSLQFLWTPSVGMHRSPNHAIVKKVCIPEVPDLPGMTATSCSPISPNGRHFSSQQAINGHGSAGGRGDYSSGTLPRSHKPVRRRQLIPAGVPTGPNTAPPVPARDGATSFRFPPTGTSDHSGHGLSSPRHRNSTGSSSSQASSGFESMKSSGNPYVNVQIGNVHGESPPSRNSYHSSGSSSLGSLERLDEAGFVSNHVNIYEMVLNGVPDCEIIEAWLKSLQYDEYVPLFLTAGYDLATIARMTPEDLTAIGITKPGHRKRITTEIHKLNIQCNIPNYIPNTLFEWLSMLNMNEYVPLFESQGYRSLADIQNLIWEDLEDIGIKKLGHMKKLGLAIKRLNELKRQRRKNSDRGSAMGTGDVLITNTTKDNDSPQDATQQARSPRIAAEVRPYYHRARPDFTISLEHPSQVGLPAFGGSGHPASLPKHDSPLRSFRHTSTTPSRSSPQYPASLADPLCRANTVAPRDEPVPCSSAGTFVVHQDPSLRSKEENGLSNGLAALGPKEAPTDSDPKALVPGLSRCSSLPHNGGLEKPKISVKPRPVAKIAAECKKIFRDTLSNDNMHSDKSAPSRQLSFPEQRELDLDTAVLRLHASQTSGPSLKPGICSNLLQELNGFTMPHRRDHLAHGGKNGLRCPAANPLEKTPLTCSMPGSAGTGLGLVHCSPARSGLLRSGDPHLAQSSLIAACGKRFDHNGNDTEPGTPPPYFKIPDKPPLPTPAPTLLTSTTDSLFGFSSSSMSSLESPDSDNSSLSEGFPPLPSPLKCEESLSALRNLRDAAKCSTNSDAEGLKSQKSAGDLHPNNGSSLLARRMSDTTHPSASKKATERTSSLGASISKSSCTAPGHQDPTQQPGSAASSPHLARNPSSCGSSIGSASSSETLPFASEGLGTIKQRRQRHGGSVSFPMLSNASSPHYQKPSVIEFFSDTSSSRQSDSAVKDTTDSEDVLDDCFDMLQGLSSELDALL